MTLNNDRVKPREFFTELRLLRQEQKESERRIMDKLDDISDKYATKEDVMDLRKRIRNADVVLGVGVILATTIGTIFGRK